MQLSHKVVQWNDNIYTVILILNDTIRTVITIKILIKHNK